MTHPDLIWDEANVITIADLKAAADRLKEAGVSDTPTFIVHPSVDLSALREKCLSMDPVRGVGCNEPLGHSGDHKSVGGFPWENEHSPRPKYEGASAEDMEAIHEVLQTPWDEVTPCDDCGAGPGEPCNPDVEH